MLSIVSNSESELDKWRFKLGLGATIRKGNTDQSDVTLKAETRRQTPNTRFAASYMGNFSELDGEGTANNHRADGKFDVFLTRRFFLSPVFIEFYRDEFQNIDYRIAPGTGFGYDIIRQEDFTHSMEWESTIGASYRIERAISLVPGEAEESKEAAAVL